MGIFLLINILGIAYLQDEMRDMAGAFNWFTLFILALGTYRLTDIIVYEKVSEPFRMLFMKEVVHGDKKEIRPYITGFRGFLAILLNCNSCTGVWVAMLTVYAFILFPYPTLIVMVIMTLTGFERIFSKIYNCLERNEK